MRQKFQNIIFPAPIVVSALGQNVIAVHASIASMMAEGEK